MRCSRWGLVSYSLNVRKDEPLFYDLVITAAQCLPRKALFVVDRIDCDVAAGMRTKMSTHVTRDQGLPAAISRSSAHHEPGRSLP
jgi:hypothetical protein